MWMPRARAKTSILERAHSRPSLWTSDPGGGSFLALAVIVRVLNLDRRRVEGTLVLSVLLCIVFVLPSPLVVVLSCCLRQRWSSSCWLGLWSYLL